MRWPGVLLRAVGWLLTPLVAWAVSLCAAWFVFSVASRGWDPRRVLLAALGAAFLLGTVTLFLWMLLLRRSPRLRKSLHITREGLPVLDEPASPPASATDAEPAATPPPEDD
jgi:hypothetical protein